MYFSFFFFVYISGLTAILKSVVGSLPTRVDHKNRTKAFGGLRFFFHLRTVMDVMHLGAVIRMDCADKAHRQLLFYAYKRGLHYAEFHKMKQQWMQCKHARYLFHNEVLVHYTVGTSGMTWR
jgi:hypothetical protein